MRVGFAVSFIGHGLVLAWAGLNLANSNPADYETQAALPVEIVTLGDETEITAGTATGDETLPPQAPDPEPVAEDDRVEEIVPDAETTEQEPAPAPEPEQVRVIEPAPPEPAAPEAAEPAPEPSPEPEPDPLPDVASIPLPRDKPTPPPRSEPEPRQNQPTPLNPQEASDQFDADRIAALLDKSPDERGGQVEAPQQGETASLGSSRGPGDRLTISEIDALRQQIERCWNPPVGVLEADGLVVRINMELGPDGFVIGTPRVMNSNLDTNFQIAAEAAIRAVSQCQPYTMLPTEKYDVWKNMILNFDPREMVGG